MSDASKPARLLSFDEHVDEWFIVNAVTPVEFVTASLKSGKREQVMRAIDAGAEPLGLLKEHAPLGQAPLSVRLARIESMEWHSDDNELVVRYYDDLKQKQRRVYGAFSTQDARLKCIETIEAEVGPSKRAEQPASIWRIGTTQLTVSVIVMLISGAIAYAGNLSDGKVDVDNMSRRGRRLTVLFNALGSTGVLLVGIGITAIMMAWWYVACRNPPMKSISTPNRDARSLL